MFLKGLKVKFSFTEIEWKEKFVFPKKCWTLYVIIVLFVEGLKVKFSCTRTKRRNQFYYVFSLECDIARTQVNCSLFLWPLSGTRNSRRNGRPLSQTSATLHLCSLVTQPRRCLVQSDRLLFRILGIPEITKDSASEANYSEEDDPNRRARPPAHHRQYGPPGQPQPGTHRPARINAATASRPPDPYYDQAGETS